MFRGIDNLAYSPEKSQEARNGVTKKGEAPIIRRRNTSTGLEVKDGTSLTTFTNTDAAALTRIRHICEEVKKEHQEQSSRTQLQQQWRQAATVADRLLLIFFVIITCVMYLIVFLSAIMQM